MTNLNDGRVDERPVGSLTGLTPEAAKEFHSVFLLSFAIFTVIAIVAHVLVWSWRPWLAASAEIEGAAQFAQTLLTTLV